MALHLGNATTDLFGELRYQPTTKRVRALVGGTTVADSRRAVLVWEPSRIVPSYAVPEDDVLVDLSPVPRTDDATADRVRISAGGPGLLDPRSPFAVHTTGGEPLTLRAPEREIPAAFRPADADLAGYVVLDFHAFDQWLEEDEPIVAHPRDPFKRIDVRQSSRQVRIERDGQVLAESARPRMLYETLLPDRYYLPREDVTVDLRPSDTATFCAYKGKATHWSVEVDGRPLRDIAWTYLEPLSDAVDVRGLVAFYTERLDLVLDGEPQPRPVTPWS